MEQSNTQTRLREQLAEEIIRRCIMWDEVDDISGTLYAAGLDEYARMTWEVGPGFSPHGDLLIGHDSDPYDGDPIVFTIDERPLRLRHTEAVEFAREWLVEQIVEVSNA